MQILFSADQHLGFRQYGFIERADDFMLATAYVFKQAELMKVDAVILGGDMFQSVHPPAEAVYFLHTMVRSLKVPVYGVDGNHDAAANAWMKVCGIIPLGNTVQTCCGVRINGLNGAAANVLRTEMQTRVKNLQDAGQRVDIFVLHTEVAELCGYDNVGMRATEIADILRPVGVELVLMGHIHDYKEAEIAGMRFIYSGSTEMTAKDEAPNKSFSVITVENGKVTTAVHPIPTRPVFEKFIKTEGELDMLMAEITKAGGGGRPPMAMIYYDKSLADFGKRAEALLTGKAIYRLIPQSSNQVSGDVFAQLSQQTFERKGVLRNLKDVLTQTFGQGSEEGNLVVQMMDNPDNVREIVATYAQSKGLDIK